MNKRKKKRQTEKKKERIYQILAKEESGKRERERGGDQENVDECEKKI